MTTCQPNHKSSCSNHYACHGFFHMVGWKQEQWRTIKSLNVKFRIKFGTALPVLSRVETIRFLQRLPWAISHCASSTVKSCVISMCVKTSMPHTTEAMEGVNAFFAVVWISWENGPKGACPSEWAGGSLHLTSTDLHLPWTIVEYLHRSRS